MSREPSFAGTNHKILQFMFYVTMFLAMSILSDSSEPPSKSVVSTWCENIGYRFFWGTLSCYSVLFKSTFNKATETERKTGKQEKQKEQINKKKGKREKQGKTKNT